MQLTPVMPVAGFPNSSDVMNLIQSKDYFKRCSSLLNCALDGVVRHDVALCALGGLVNHMSRLMVSLLSWPF